MTFSTHAMIVSQPWINVKCFQLFLHRIVTLCFLIHWTPNKLWANLIQTLNKQCWFLNSCNDYNILCIYCQYIFVKYFRLTLVKCIWNDDIHVSRSLGRASFPLDEYNFAPFRTAMLVGQDKFQTALDCRHQPKVFYKILMNLRDKQDCFITFNTSIIAPTWLIVNNFFVVF
jgi:hypothetical protein